MFRKQTVLQQTMLRHAKDVSPASLLYSASQMHNCNFMPGLLSDSLWPSLSISGSLWLSLWPSPALSGSLARSPDLSGSLWLSQALSGSHWLSIALRICLQSPCLAHKALAWLRMSLLRTLIISVQAKPKGFFGFFPDFISLMYLPDGLATAATGINKCYFAPKGSITGKCWYQIQLCGKRST